MASSIFRTGLLQPVGYQRFEEAPAKVGSEDDDDGIYNAAEHAGGDRVALSHAAEIKVQNPGKPIGRTQNDEDTKPTIYEGNGNRWNRPGPSAFCWWPQEMVDHTLRDYHHCWNRDHRQRNPEG